MCEPAHSIVQYPINDDYGGDDNLPFGGQMDRETRLKAALGKAMDWGKKVLRWFHFSKLGSGHAGAGPVHGRQIFYLPNETRYEGKWWERRVDPDGSYYGHPMDKEEALHAADLYCRDVVLGSMSKFRRFLETSIKKSSGWGYRYAEQFLEYVLTSAGRDAVLAKFRNIFGVREACSVTRLFNGSEGNPAKQKAIDCLMGFTRKRNLFVPLWADEPSLWVPQQAQVVVQKLVVCS